ncbi:monocarboxylate transporter 12-B-like isoform X1 [Mercenaria mercenaria]|uniref:monocarboxylate transporter 12-B-like isoform X1 n=1 Tax=Mercenaria mercenaria TaxID=6596 RepID=UPI00234F81BA|nr:monocarboxylate transporter 12-B-like isoform X1 [Mercenaria mercenaria]XP_053395179.1 monocarboxylate transporter 12-B-like isoform X1 [Mercenaria mercenaria]
MALMKNTISNVQPDEETEHMALKKNDGTVVPPDGGLGWMIVLGSFLVHLITDGILYSFGILYIEFLDYYKGGKGETAWIGSLAIGFQLLAGPLASILTNKFGCRLTTIVGSVAVALGFVLSIFSPNLYFLYFSFGAISGIGFCLTYLPAVVSVGHYFEKKRTFAVGLASCGSGIGSFIFNPLTKYLIDVYAWRGAVLIQAGIVLNCVLCGAIFRPLEKQTTPAPETMALEKLKVREGNFLLTSDTTDLRLCADNSDNVHGSQSFLEQPSTSEVENSKRYACKDENGSFHCESSLQKKENPQEQRLRAEDLADQFHRHEELSPSDIDSNTSALLPTSDRKTKSFELVADDKTKFAKTLCCGYGRTDLQRTMKQSCNFSPQKNLIFIMYLISNVFASLSLNVPFVFLYGHAIDQGIDTESAKWLGSIIGIANTFGRILSGLIADKFKINRLLLFNTTLTICGIATTLCPLCFNFTSLVLFSCVFGLSFGIYVPLMSVVLVDLLGLELLNNSFGLLLMFKGIANLIGPPVAGWLYDATGSYDIPFIIGGITLTASGIVLYPVTCIKTCRKNKECKGEERSNKTKHTG